MDKTAVIKIGPFQYRVEEGKQYTVPRFVAEEGKKFDVDQVLMVSTDKNTTFGTPTIKGAKVTLKIDEQGKGEKVRTSTYKAKTGNRRTVGHRKKVTTFTVDTITTK